LDDRSIPLATTLHSLAINAGRPRCSISPLACLLAAIVVDVFEVKGVDVAWEISISVMLATIDAVVEKR
jgi:hypothetical protein